MIKTDENSEMDQKEDLSKHGAEKVIQEKYLNLQLISSQIKQGQQQLQQIDQQMVDLNSVIESLNEFKLLKVEKPMLVPISGGIFAKGILKDNSKLIVNVGSGVAVEKSVEETNALLNERISETEAIRSEAISELQQLIGQAHSLEQELSILIGKQEK